MRIILGYDGSACASDAVADLSRAGLPSETDVIVLAAADIWPTRPNWTFDETSSSTEHWQRMTLSERAAYELAAEAMRMARAAAHEGAERVRTLRPDLRVEPCVCPGPPAASLIDEAAKRKADLIVVGSRGRSLLRGLLLGSVSRRVLAHAPCSVRVGRIRERDQSRCARIVLGMDGSKNAVFAARAVASRHWPAGSEVRIIAALDVHLITARCAVNIVAGEPSLCDGDVDARTWIGRICDSVKHDLAAANLAATIEIREGDAATALLDEARSWGGDCIFLGATGLRGFERFVIGSVSTTVAEHATCSVEVVRPPAIGDICNQH